MKFISVAKFHRLTELNNNFQETINILTAGKHNIRLKFI